MSSILNMLAVKTVRNRFRPLRQQQPTASQQQQPAPVQPKDGFGGPCTAPGEFTEVLYQGKLPINRLSGRYVMSCPCILCLRDVILSWL